MWHISRNSRSGEQHGEPQVWTDGRSEMQKKQIWPMEIHAGAGAEMGDVTGMHYQDIGRGAALLGGAE